MLAAAWGAPASVATVALAPSSRACLRRRGALRGAAASRRRLALVPPVLVASGRRGAPAPRALRRRTRSCARSLLRSVVLSVLDVSEEILAVAIGVLDVAAEILALAVLVPLAEKVRVLLCGPLGLLLGAVVGALFVRFLGGVLND